MLLCAPACCRCTVGTDLGDSEAVLGSQPRGMVRKWGLGTHGKLSFCIALCDLGEAAFIAGESHAVGGCEFGSIYGKQ